MLSRVKLLFFIIFLTLFLWPMSIKAETESKLETLPTLQHIFIISVEGFNYEGYVGVNCSNIKHMASEGIKDEKCLALKVDSIEAAQASLLTGTFPEEHKFITKNDKVEVESLFDILKRQGLSFVVVDGSGGKLRPLAHSDTTYVKINSDLSDKEVLDIAYKHFEKNRPFLTYVYLNDCMEKLLTLDDKAYYNAVKLLDQNVGDFLANLRKENLYYNSLIIITSPRSSSPSNMVPLIVQGPKCKKNGAISNSITLDVMPTISKLSNLPKPNSARGIPIYEGLDVTDNENKYLNHNYITELKSERIRTLNNYFTLEDDLFRTKYQIASIKEEKQNIFNFLGEKEKDISKLKLRLTWERLAYLGMFLLMIAGYYIEYLFLKKKFLLFR